MSDPVYLDYNATTPEVADAMLPFLPPVNFPVIQTVDRVNVLSITQQDQGVGCGR